MSPDLLKRQEPGGVPWEVLGETPQFREEMENPVLITAGRIRQAWWVLNRDHFDRQPFYLQLGINTPTDSPAGRHLLSELCSRLDRPIIISDPEALGLTSAPDPYQLLTTDFKDRAERRLRTLRRLGDKIGFDRFHAGGTSLGGLDVFMMGLIDEEQIDSLTTLSMPFQTVKPTNTAQALLDLFTRFTEERHNRKALPPDVSERRKLYKEYYAANKTTRGKNIGTTALRYITAMSRFRELLGEISEEHLHSGNIPTLLKTGWDITATTPELTKKLARRIRWLDVVGEEEQVTYADDHVDAVTIRKLHSPMSKSEVVVLPGVNHSWIENPVDVAETLEDALAEAA